MHQAPAQPSPPECFYYSIIASNLILAVKARCIISLQKNAICGTFQMRDVLESETLPGVKHCPPPKKYIKSHH